MTTILASAGAGLVLATASGLPLRVQARAAAAGMKAHIAWRNIGPDQAGRGSAVAGVPFIVTESAK